MTFKMQSIHPSKYQQTSSPHHGGLVAIYEVLQ
jgi:hypothetical protein